MSKITNLNLFRKQKTRESARKQADANSVKFGRSKSQVKKEKTDIEQASRHLDGVKRDD